ncbi:hypothetical protein MUK42_25520 [Musa troglodytarum]|uniref:Uncharacterized protein n=1 Tax=Musa troglodytarum TaxID=320322 RepID=A0A9E7EF63_9LILI|nr:hypothetical protein MUK42_25520 [Musa troglodytarum]
MITRSKLVEQLREYQIRSQHKWGALTAFSPKPQITARRDVALALTYAVVFVLLIASCYASLYFRYFKVSAVFVCFGILLQTCLKISRHRWVARKRERRMLLPLSM